VSADVLRRAAERLREVAGKATPGPWRDSTVDGNRYGALVADQPHPDRPNPASGGWGWDEGYGGCLIGESLMRADRAYIATVHPGVALALADWLDLEIEVRASMARNGLSSLALDAEHPATIVARAILGETPDGAP
jgi:hypothetical protein